MIADGKSVVMLGRIIEWKEHGVDVEVDLISKEIGMEECKGSDVVERTRLEKTRRANASAGRTAMSVRCGGMYLHRRTALTSSSRAREVCWWTSAPCKSDWKMLKSMTRYVKSHPRVLLQYKYLEPPLSVDATMDTDFAGCRRTRKFTNGSYTFHGTHLIKSWAPRGP